MQKTTGHRINSHMLSTPWTHCSFAFFPLLVLLQYTHYSHIIYNGSARARAPYRLMSGTGLQPFWVHRRIMAPIRKCCSGAIGISSSRHFGHRKLFAPNCPQCVRIFVAEDKRLITESNSWHHCLLRYRRHSWHHCLLRYQ